jgi:hypothetical protein
MLRPEVVPSRREDNNCLLLATGFEGFFYVGDGVFARIGLQAEVGDGDLFGLLRRNRLPDETANAKYRKEERFFHIR